MTHKKMHRDTMFVITLLNKTPVYPESFAQGPDGSPNLVKPAWARKAITRQERQFCRTILWTVKP